MKTRTDTERFARYQSVVNLLLTKDSFYKPDIYESLGDEEKAFIGRVITKLVQDGYLTQNGLKSKPLYLWSEEKWLELIKRHLLENLLMEKEDMDYLPIFTREGASWGKLNKVFDDDLETIILEINEAIAA